MKPIYYIWRLAGLIFWAFLAVSFAAYCLGASVECWLTLLLISSFGAAVCVLIRAWYSGDFRNSFIKHQK
jgi:hypothetical protein